MGETHRELRVSDDGLDHVDERALAAVRPAADLDEARRVLAVEPHHLGVRRAVPHRERVEHLADIDGGGTTVMMAGGTVTGPFRSAEWSRGRSEA